MCSASQEEENFIGSLKLREEAEIAALELANVIDGVTHHNKAGEAEAEGKTAVLFGVDAAETEDVRMDETAGQ